MASNAGNNAGNTYGRLPSQDGDEGDWMQSHLRQHQTQLAQQDEHLDEIGRGVDRLGHISLEIHRELEGQSKMLGELDEDFENAIDGLDMVTRRTQDLIRRSGGMRNFTIIAVLLLVLLLLLALVFYT
ncbi:unnamed protein product [Chrysoparadoxa australica]